MATSATKTLGQTDSFAALCALVTQLRAPGGCPWDRQQTLASLRPYLLEEAYEALEALESGDPQAHCDELGDLLLQVVQQAELQREAGHFNIEAVTQGIYAKLLRRHPHLFGQAPPTQSADEAFALWEAQKARERTAGSSRLAGVPKAMPALKRASRIHDKAAAAGFDWPDAQAARRKVGEEWREFCQAWADNQPDAMEDELGDVLMSLCSLARHLKLDTESALRRTIDKFTRRFAYVEKSVEDGGETFADVPKARLEALWEEAKRQAASLPQSGIP